MIPIDFQVSRVKVKVKGHASLLHPCATDNSKTLCPRSLKLGRWIVLGDYMIPIDIQVSRSKVKVKGHASLLHLVQLITQERFAPEASILVGR